MPGERINRVILPIGALANSLKISANTGTAGGNYKVQLIENASATVVSEAALVVGATPESGDSGGQCSANRWSSRILLSGYG